MRSEHPGVHRDLGHPHREKRRAKKPGTLGQENWVKGGDVAVDIFWGFEARTGERVELWGVDGAIGAYAGGSGVRRDSFV